VPKYKLNSAETEVVELSNMAVNGCAEGGAGGFEGYVVQRRFDENYGTVLQGFVIEEQDGSREYINVVTKGLDDAGAVTRVWVLQGLQTLLSVGSSVKVEVLLCGAAGRVMLLDRVTR
jgi:hypothetical protein